ncbi:MAG: winged helix DNA-binding protein [Alphaproteobacteria bacterium]
MPKKPMPKKPAALQRSVLSAVGHLSVTPTEARLTGLEFTLEHLVQAYYRWKALCFRTVSDLPLSGEDVAVLNTIRMGDDAKGLSEIGALLNRADIPNLQYALRKLAKAGLIENAGAASRRKTRYRVTAAGRAATDAYARMRAEILMPIVEGDTAPIDLAALERTLGILARHYEQAGHQAIMGRRRDVPRTAASAPRGLSPKS